MTLTTQSAARKDAMSGAHRTTMEHRHFAVIADILGSLPLDGLAWTNVVAHFNQELATTNPRFDSSRFVNACLQKRA